MQKTPHRAGPIEHSLCCADKRCDAPKCPELCFVPTRFRPLQYARGGALFLPISKLGNTALFLCPKGSCAPSLPPLPSGGGGNTELFLYVIRGLAVCEKSSCRNAACFERFYRERTVWVVVVHAPIIPYRRIEGEGVR